MQAPMAQPRHNRRPGQSGTMQKEQQRNRRRGQPLKELRRCALCRQQACQDDGGDQGQGEVVREETGSLHGVEV